MRNDRRDNFIFLIGMLKNTVAMSSTFSSFDGMSTYIDVYTAFSTIDCLPKNKYHVLKIDIFKVATPEEFIEFFKDIE